MKVKVRDFRVFKETQFLDIRPITLLIGENSSGKTSILAALNYIFRFRPGSPPPSFNNAPFELGGFDSIVHRTKGRARPNSFSISITANVDLENDDLMMAFNSDKEKKVDFSEVCLELSFSQYYGEARISRVTVLVDDLRFEIDLSAEPTAKITEDVRVLYPEENAQDAFDFKLPSTQRQRIDAQYLLYLAQNIYFSTRRDGTRSKNDQKVRRCVLALEAAMNALPASTYASAPVRSNPTRVYNPSDFVTQPDGTHVPYTLNRLKASDRRRWESVQNSLQRFGRAAGLYTKVNVSRFRDSESSPFEVSVTVHGRQSNLLDVGYGVSQSLPIVVDILESRPNTAFLFQQPEVHLHPVAQAALASFFVSQINLKDNLHLIAETHSDYFIDRLRIDVMEGNIDPSQIAILFLEHNKSTTKIHNIEINKQGDLTGAPSSYREFFMKEQYRLLGLS